MKKMVLFYSASSCALCSVCCGKQTATDNVNKQRCVSVNRDHEASKKLDTVLVRQAGKQVCRLEQCRQVKRVGHMGKTERRLSLLAVPDLAQEAAYRHKQSRQNGSSHKPKFIFCRMMGEKVHLLWSTAPE